MTDFQSDFDVVNRAIDDTVATQVSSSFSWKNVPGWLAKASASSAGYVWGFNDASGVFVCQMPCAGNWTPVVVPGLLSVLDMTADGGSVYILGNATNGALSMFVGPATNQGPWTHIPVPFAATKIFSTHTFVWAQDARNAKRRCPKPCMAGNWIAVPDTKVAITSSSDSALYGRDASGTAMRTDETLQSEWSPIAGLAKTKVLKVIGDIDATALFAVDEGSHVVECAGACDTEPVPLDTAGFAPTNMTAEGQTMWMTSETSGALGNVFSRATTSSYTNIINDVRPLEQRRDGIADTVKKEFASQTDRMTISKQIESVVSFFKGVFNSSNDTAASTKNKSGELKDLIQHAQAQADLLRAQEPFMKVMFFTLIIVGAIYVIGSVLGSMIHMVAFLVLIAGFFMAVNVSS